MKKRKCNVLSKELIAKRPKLELDCCCQSCDKGTGLIITNIKASFKLDIPAEFEYIKKRCSELPKSLEIVCDQTQPNILTIRFNSRTYICFKRSSNNTQWINITRCKCEQDIIEGIQDLLFLIDQPPKIIPFKIDNISCTGYLGKAVVLNDIYIEHLNEDLRYNPERFSALEIRCPSVISANRWKSLCCLLYKSGRLVIVGGDSISEIEKFYNWVKNIAIGEQ